MNRTRRLRDLCCLTQATLLNVCLDDDDLRALGVWNDEPNGRGFSPAVWCRAFLHKACRRDPEVARQLSDVLDLRHVDSVVVVRCKDEDELAADVAAWLARPRGEELPGLLWALCTDHRDAVHALGARLCHEAATVAFRALVRGEASPT